MTLLARPWAGLMDRAMENRPLKDACDGHFSVPSKCPWRFGSGRIRYYYYRYWREEPVSRVSADFVTLLTFFLLLDVVGREFHTDDRRAGDAPSLDHDGATAYLNAPEHLAIVSLHGLQQLLV